MQTINQSTFDYLKSGNLVDVRIRCSGLAGDLTILGEDIIQGTFSIDRNSTSGVNVEIGCAETTELTFELNNADHRFDSYKFEGAVLTVDILANDEYIRAGRFIVDKRPNTYRRVKIVALDYMAKFNKVYVPTVANGATLFEILQDCCTQCGVTMHDLSIVNGSVPCLVPTDEVTCHEVVSMVAELSGANAWIDYNGELNLSWYGENQSSEIVIDSGSRFSYDVAENDIVISGVVYRTEDTDTLIGSDTYALIIENNDLVDSTQVSTLLTNIYNRVNGTIYRPFKFDIQGMPHYWPLDVITFADANGTLFTSIITNHNYILNGVSSIQGKGESATIASYAANSPFTARQKKVLNKVIDLRAGQQITALDQAMIQLNELAANAQGFYQTVVTDPVTQARIDYMHNQPLLANSTIVYKRTVDGFFWTDNYQGESTIWTSGYTASGNIVAKTLSVVGINADWISTGSITGQKLADGTISDVKIATGLNASKITTGSLTSSNFSGTGDGSGFSTAGSKINMNNGTLSTPSFRIDSDGNAEFAGNLASPTGDIGGFTLESGKITSDYFTLDPAGSRSIDITSPNNPSGYFYVDGAATLYTNSIISGGAYIGFLTVGYCSGCSSWRELKKDIDLFNKERAYQIIKNVEVCKYKYKDEPTGQDNIHIGSMMDDMPEEFLIKNSSAPKGIAYDINSMIHISMAAMQNLMDKIESLEKRVEQLEKSK